MKISQDNFKKLLKGENLNKLYPNNFRLINIEIIRNDNQTVVSGSFELSEDLEFNKEDKFDKEIIFDGGNYANIIFKGGYFKKLLFRRGNYSGYVSIRGGTFENILLLGGSFDHWLGTLNGKGNYENGLELADEKLAINRFEIEGGNYKNNIWITGGEIDILELKCLTPIIVNCMSNDSKVYDQKEKKLSNEFISTPLIKKLYISRYLNKSSFYNLIDLNVESLFF